MQPEAPPEVRKMAQPVCAPPRRGSAAGPSMAGPLGMGDEAPAAASSPIPQQPPQSLSLLGPGPPPQPQLGPKKKSGFQITSVTPAQASASLSSNNSIAEDTESYDDLDESHTEDLSSSEILDASLSRATDLGAPGRSSSEETLSNLQEAETPGALSPNQPRLPGVLPPLVNGILGPQEQHHYHHHHAPVANVNMMNNQNPATAPHQHPITQAAQAVAAAALGSAVGHQQPPPQASAPMTTMGTSRFRVVKLDSSSEPFRKGRWTCTEYYEREPPGGEAPHKAVESVRQAEVGSERESTSESSVSSTLSHYTESAGSGEGAQACSDPTPQTHPQDPGYGGQHKAAFQAPAPAVGMHQHSYSPQVQPVQTLPQIHYAAQQQILPTHLPHGMAPTQTVTGSIADYVQHPPVLQPAKPHVQSGHNPQQHMQTSAMQPTAVQAQSSMASALPTTAHATTLMSAAAASAQSVGVVPPVNLPSAVQQPPTSNQGMSSHLQHSVTAQSSQLMQGPQSGIIQHAMQMVASGHPPQVLIPQNTPMPVKPQPQGLDPMLQGKHNQQMPAISPIPPSATVPSMTTSAALVSAPTMTQSSTVHNGAQGVTHLTASLPGTHHTPHQIPLNSAQFFPPSLIQSVANQIADARRLMEHSVVSGLPQSIMSEGISGMGVSSALDESGSITGTGQLLPLKTLPLSTPLVDGEDESSSGASVVAIDNKIEQAMDLVKSHLMYAVREEVEVLKEQIKELIEKNSQLEQENSLLKTLASPEQMAQFQAQLQTSSPATTQPPAPPASGPPGTA